MRIALPLALALALASSALAKPPADAHHPSTKATTAPAGTQGMMGMMQGMMKCPMAGHTEGTLAFLKTELNITSAQSKTWEAFASAYRDIAASQGSMMGEGMMGGGMMGGDGKSAMMAKPFPDRMAMHTQMMERHLKATKEVQAAVDPLYAALDAKQRKTADELLPMITMMAVM